MTAAVRVDVCMFEVEAWGPHPGCAEFMDEVETWTCEAPADVIHIVEEVGMPEADDPDRVVTVLTLCREHAELCVLAYPTDPWVLSYTIKPLHR